MGAARLRVFFLRAFALLAMLGATSALAAERYVSRAGDNSLNDCAIATAPCRTVAHAIDTAGAGDTINVAAGKYRENILLDATTTLDPRAAGDIGADELVP